MMIDKNQVQSHYVDECNCIHDRKDASRNKLLCSRSSQINTTVRILSCKMLWCWIGLSDAWAAVFFYEIRRPELNPFFRSMNNDVQVQLLIAIWTEASGNTIVLYIYCMNDTTV